jgi:hypothetical protein
MPKVLKDPNKGTQLLFMAGQHDNKIRVKSGWLPSSDSISYQRLIDQKSTPHTAHIGIQYRKQNSI